MHRSPGGKGIAAARVRRLLAALAISAAAAATLAVSAHAATLTSDVWYHDGHTARWRIAGDWQFMSDPLDAGKSSGWASAVPAGARTVQIPYVWNADLSQQSFDGSVGWYYASFQAPHPGLYRIRFLSTHHTATAYLDGSEIGTHEGGFLAWESNPVQLDAGEHLLAVRADTRQQATIAQTGGRGWWNWGGISREVELREARDLDVEAVRAGTTHLGRRLAVERVAVAVTNPTATPQTGTVRIALVGRTSASSTLTLVPGEQRELVFHLHLRKPRLWSPAHPALYRLDVSTGSESTPETVAWTGMIGVRTLVARRGNLYLNGRRFFARGVALHDDARNVGAALTPADLAANFEIVRGLHANMVRSHYPLHPAFLEMLDRAGIVTWAEAPVIWLSNEQLAEPDVLHTVLDYVRETVDGQGWHASTGIWSGGNELAITEKQGPGLINYVKKARALVRALDPSRPFALAFQSRFSPEYRPFCNLVDVFGVNYYLGWYWGPHPGAHQRAVLRANLGKKIAVCPHRPWVLTEFGAEAGSAGSVHERGSYAYQSALIASTLRAARNMRQLDGATIWAGRDFAVYPGWDGGNDLHPDPPINQKGLVTLSGRLKPAYYVAAKLFRRLARR
jgi:beta-glucuronidase